MTPWGNYCKIAEMDLKKIIAKLPTGFAEDVQGDSPEKLKARLVQAETNIQRIKQERESDEKLSGARELVKDLSAPYADAEKSQRAVIAYVLALLDEKGQLPLATVTVSGEE